MPGVEETFNALMGELDYPMVIVTAAAEDRRAGCLAGFATQASIHPPRFLACLSVKNHTFRVAQGARALGVHFLPADAADLAELFGGETGDEVDKFARVEWHEGPEGVPIVDACRNWFVGRILERVDAGDHHGFLLEPIAAEHGTSGGEFTLHRARRIHPGHEA